MVTRIFLVILALLPLTAASGQYQVSSIPDSLTINAHSVIREYIVEMELQSVNKGLKKIRKAITILDKQGEDQAILLEQYDKDSHINIKQVVLYNKDGKKIKTIKQSEIIDAPAFSSYELFSDDRLKAFRPDQAEYPYTVEYIYEVTLNNLISYGKWSPLQYYNMSIQHASFILTYPPDIQIHKKEFMIHELSEGPFFNKKQCTWEIKNMPAVETEPFDAGLSARTPAVYLMPERLIYDKYTGWADNWEDYGKWIYELFKGRDEIPEAEKAKVLSLVSGIPDTTDRIKALYSYMQNNTRYVAVTMGIGGFQPFDAATVYNTGYGDCKALSNYMYSLLKVIGVRSYPALVSAGDIRTPIYHDFPNFHQFNHVILCVPRGKDTTWLECTNQQIPFGFLGDFTDDRDVLLITENGGVFAHTCKYDKDKNRRSSFTELTITPSGSSHISSHTHFMGLWYNNLERFLTMNHDEQKKWIYSNTSLPSLKILDFSIKSDKEKIPSAELRETMESPNYCSSAGQYMIIPVNRINVRDPVQKMLRKRNSKILIKRSFSDCDTLLFHLPDNFIIESLPEGISVNTEFGHYSLIITGKTNEIVCIRNLYLKEGHYKPESYSAFYAFTEAVSKADNTKIMLKKQ
ncbi:MAG TPA: DUF3857 domain-containing protein [Bacteroidales bacterium]|nr:DUF3857 domain-containing protein [Bacteroidales bacterium]